MDILLLTVIIIIAFLGMGMSLFLLIKNQARNERRISVRHFVVLLFVYATVIVGFGVLYIALELLGIPTLKEGESLQTESFLHLIEDVLYFSAVTLLTVGYGDIIPHGVGRWIAVVQALLGYLLPAAFVVTSVIYHDDINEKETNQL